MELSDEQWNCVINMIIGGAPNRLIAPAFGVHESTLARWLIATPSRARESARARELSAEAWLDEGRAAVQASLRKDSEIDPAAARNYEQACARMAAIRNPKYRDGANVTVGGDAENPLQMLVSQMSSRLPVAQRVTETLPAPADPLPAPADAPVAPPRLT